MVQAYFGMVSGSMFTRRAPWQASLLDYVSNLTLPRLTHRPDSPPLILPHTCPIEQYPDDPPSRYVQELGLFLSSISYGE